MNTPIGMLLSGRPDAIISVVVMIGFLLISLTFHEFSHSAVAYLLGDSTESQKTRMTLNPFKHVDRTGAIVYLLTGFGWAKPVMFDPRNLRGGPFRSGALVALAGPLSNLILAVVAAMLLRFVVLNRLFPLDGTILDLAITFIQLNIALGIFNLLPLPILDGFKVVQGVVWPRLAFGMALFEAKWGFSILGILVALSFLPRFLGMPFLNNFNILGNVLGPLVVTIMNILLSGRLP